MTHRHELREAALTTFLHQAPFGTTGAVILDLDGTTLHEEEGQITVPGSIKRGLRGLHALGRPIILNTLRFPQSVIRTIGPDWIAINQEPIPGIFLNGSLIGQLEKNGQGELQFREFKSFLLTEQEIDTVIDGLEKLVSAGLKDMLLFYYPRDWQLGERIWTPDPTQIPAIREKYTSCSSVVATSLTELRSELKLGETCMIFLLINAEGDQLMAYQHTHKHSYFTNNATDKTTGAIWLTTHLNVSLDCSLGAGDTELDTFLNAVGLSLQIGKRVLPYQGKHATLRLEHPRELGMCLEELAELCAKP